MIRASRATQKIASAACSTENGDNRSHSCADSTSGNSSNQSVMPLRPCAIIDIANWSSQQPASYASPYKRISPGSHCIVPGLAQQFSVIRQVETPQNTKI